LAKLTNKAIMLMEDAGGQVVGLTCDGASTTLIYLKIYKFSQYLKKVLLPIFVSKYCTIFCKHLITHIFLPKYVERFLKTLCAKYFKIVFHPMF